MTDLEKLHEALAVQGKLGNWNYDSYQRGLYNGLELALSVLEVRNPNFKEEPEDGYLCDVPAR